MEDSRRSIDQHLPGASELLIAIVAVIAQHGSVKLDIADHPAPPCLRRARDRSLPNAGTRYTSRAIWGITARARRFSIFHLLRILVVFHDYRCFYLRWAGAFSLPPSSSAMMAARPILGVSPDKAPAQQKYIPHGSAKAQVRAECSAIPISKVNDGFPVTFKRFHVIERLH